MAPGAGVGLKMNTERASSMSETSASIKNIVFIAGKGTVVAMDRYDGRVLWRWKGRAGSGFWASLAISPFTSIVVDGDRLLVATPKCIWCLDPMTGDEVWKNEIKDFAGGYPIIAASVSNASSVAAAATLLAAQQAAVMASISASSVAAAGAS
ncbi:MAG: hypothetical protein CMJ67_00260 [Planctomycetaceae bacterium]|nr:hypothetical protein [Planctomycetaceae bacterium]